MFDPDNKLQRDAVALALAGYSDWEGCSLSDRESWESDAAKALAFLRDFNLISRASDALAEAVAR